jgi:hypothetical protein
MAEQCETDTTSIGTVRSLTVTISNALDETIDKYTIVFPEGLSWRGSTEDASPNAAALDTPSSQDD